MSAFSHPTGVRRGCSGTLCLVDVPWFTAVRARAFFLSLLRGACSINYDADMKSKATTVPEYLASLPADRRDAIEAVRRVILKNLDKGFEEGMQYGMIGYYVPHSTYPAGYHCDPSLPLPFASLGSQKNFMTVGMFCIYGSGAEQERFRKAWLATGKKLDMGKSCVRFKKIDDVPLEVLGEAFQRATLKKFVAGYESALGAARKQAPKSRSASALSKEKPARPAAKSAAKGRRAS